MVDFFRVQPNQFERLIHDYASLVSEIEEGYNMCLSEYTNDMSCRNAIQRMLDGGYVASTVTMGSLKMLDERLEHLLIRTSSSIYGSNPKSSFWLWGVPSNAPEVVKDARSLGLLNGTGL